MALDQFALVEVLDALKVAEVDDRIRQAAQTIYQALIEAELTSEQLPDRAGAAAALLAPLEALAPLPDHVRSRRRGHSFWSRRTTAE